jgi:polyisoprenoid-binding protein YceI
VPRFDADSAECTVLTFKEGLLSAVAHDLELRVTRFEIDVEDGRSAVRARFEAASIRVVGATVGGAVRAGTLSDADKRKIEQSLADEVLRAREHPEVRFASTRLTPDGEGYQIAGELSLRGHTRAVDVHARAVGDRLVAEVRVHQPDFGIKPFTAMLGAIKIKPDVIVRCAIPLLTR